MIFQIFSPKILEQALAISTENAAILCRKFIITLVFEKDCQFCHRKLVETAKNWNQNIDPCLHEIWLFCFVARQANTIDNLGCFIEKEMYCLDLKRLRFSSFQDFNLKSV
jgi:hypothetical protein